MQFGHRGELRVRVVGRRHARRPRRVGDDRKILEYVVENLLPDSIDVELVEATDNSNAKIASGEGDLAYFQHIPAFDADVAEHSYDNLNVVSKANVVPYALYSSRWTGIADTEDQVNSGLVEDSVTGSDLPHGSQVVLPSSPTGFARGASICCRARIL